MEYASKGVAGTGLGLGAAALGVNLLNGNLGNLFGGWNGNCAGFANAACSENMGVNRYELNMQKELINRDAEIAYLRGRDAAKTDGLELYRYIDGQLKDVREALCAQAVHNQKTEDSFVLAKQDIASVRRELGEQIKLEAERRCCGDNSIVNYANATFYPKSVADVTVGTTTTAQTLYNPLPDCGCCCGN